MTVRLEPGAEAPDFTLVNQDEKDVSLHDLRGQGVILFFYPQAMTPGRSAGYVVLGISRDAPAKLRAFRERDALPYDLLSDPDRAVHEAYGAWGEKTMYGKTTEGVLRSTFVLDADGVVTHALYNVKATGHVARIRGLLGV